MHMILEGFIIEILLNIYMINWIYLVIEHIAWCDGENSFIYIPLLFLVNAQFKKNVFRCENSFIYIISLVLQIP